MAIKMICSNCGSENIAIDLKRHMAWCRDCKENDQISIETFDPEDTKEE